jgi:paraquat-inducible protein B
MPTGKATAVGAFVLGALALGVIAVLLFAGRSLFTTKLLMVAYFQNSVAGLAVGAPVTLRGVKVGTVKSMKVFLKLPDLVPVIPVYLEIQPSQVSWTNDSITADATDVSVAVKAGLRAQLATQSLVTGQVSVNLDFHPETPATYVGSGDGVPEIPTIPSDFQHFRDEIADLKLPDLADKARTALTGINQIVGELNGKVGPMADSLRQTSDNARTTLDTAAAAVHQLQLDASQALKSVDHLATSAEAQVDTTGKELDQAVATVNRAATQAEKVMDNLHDITSAHSPVRGDLEAAVRDLAASAASLRNFSRDVERHPNDLLLGRSSK